MANGEERQEQRQTLPKRVSLEEDGYYANCAMVEMTPFDLSILFGMVHSVSDANGQRSLVELYDQQVYLSQAGQGLVLGPGQARQPTESAFRGIRSPAVEIGIARGYGGRRGQVLTLDEADFRVDIMQGEVLCR